MYPRVACFIYRALSINLVACIVHSPLYLLAFYIMPSQKYLMVFYIMHSQLYLKVFYIMHSQLYLMVFYKMYSLNYTSWCVIYRAPLSFSLSNTLVISTCWKFSSDLLRIYYYAKLCFWIIIFMSTLNKYNVNNYIGELWKYKINTVLLINKLSFTQTQLSDKVNRVQA